MNQTSISILHFYDLISDSSTFQIIEFVNLKSMKSELKLI
jgi:hypothetical protein